MSGMVYTAPRWCPPDRSVDPCLGCPQCDPEACCQPPTDVSCFQVPILPPPPVSGTWPPPGNALQVTTYLQQDHLTNGVPDGGSILDGWGAQWITPSGTGNFGWIWGPEPPNPNYGPAYLVTYLDYDQPIGTLPVPGQTTAAPDQASIEAQATAIATGFQQYFWG